MTLRGLADPGGSHGAGAPQGERDGAADGARDVRQAAEHVKYRQAAQKDSTVPRRCSGPGGERPGGARCGGEHGVSALGILPTARVLRRRARLGGEPTRGFLPAAPREKALYTAAESVSSARALSPACLEASRFPWPLDVSCRSANAVRSEWQDGRGEGGPEPAQGFSGRCPPMRVSGHLSEGFSLTRMTRVRQIHSPEGGAGERDAMPPTWAESPAARREIG
jgi:hypothetical protein